MNNQLHLEFLSIVFLLASTGALASMMLTLGASPTTVVWLVLQVAIYAASVFEELR